MHKNDLLQEIFEITLRDKKQRMILNICKLTEKELPDDIEEVLNEEELIAYKKVSSQKRKKEMYFGRLMAKIAIKQISEKQVELKAAVVAKGAFNNPLFKGEFADYGVSISHCKEYVAAIVFSGQLLVGLDIEMLDDKRVHQLSMCISSSEMLLRPDKMSNEVFFFLIWTCKEALGKSVKLGLTINYGVLQIDSIQPISNGFISTFLNFPKLMAYTQIKEDYIYTIVYPQLVGLEHISKK